MSVGYATLKADLAAWLNRADLTASIPTFVRLAEARFNRILRVGPMMQTAQAQATGYTLALPEDWLESRDIQIDGAPVYYITPEETARLRVAGTATGERFFTVIDDTLEFVPTPSANATVLLAYYARIPELSETVTSNWLLAHHYDAYLYGALTHSAPFLLEDERTPMWKAALDLAMAEIQEEDSRARRSGATLQSRRKPGYG